MHVNSLSEKLNVDSNSRPIDPKVKFLPLDHDAPRAVHIDQHLLGEKTAMLRITVLYVNGG